MELDAAQPSPADSPALSPEAQRKLDKDRRFGREIAFGIQQTIACWATDFIDPLISKWYQNQWGDQKHHVTEAHTFGGEFVGDSAAFFAYLFAKRVFTAPIDGMIAIVQSAGDSTLARMGKSALKPWALAHGASEDDPRYKRKMEEYKHFQAENAVDSSLIAVSATGLNVLAQRHMFGNKQSYGTIFSSKLLGAGLTLGLMGLLRVGLPTSTRMLDEEIETRYSSKLIRFTKKILGVKQEPAHAITAQDETDMAAPHRLSAEKRDGLLALVAEHAAKIDMDDPKQLAALIARQKAVYHAFLDTLAPDGYLVGVMAREHYEVVEKNYKQCFDHLGAAERNQDREASHASVQAAAEEKRRDMQAFIALLDDPAFIDDVRKAVATGTVPPRRNAEISKDAKDHLSMALMQTARGKADSAQAIFDKAEEQVVEYKALAHSLEPDGIVTRILASELKKRLPDYDAKDVEGIARDYMQYYQKDALNLAQEFKPDSHTVQHAVERSKELGQKYRAAATDAAYSLAS